MDSWKTTDPSFRHSLIASYLLNWPKRKHALQDVITTLSTLLQIPPSHISSIDPGLYCPLFMTSTSLMGGKKDKQEIKISSSKFLFFLSLSWQNYNLNTALCQTFALTREA